MDIETMNLLTLHFTIFYNDISNIFIILFYSYFTNFPILIIFSFF